jgi:hypothetical protein
MRLIAGYNYGTNVIRLAHRFLLQYVVPVNKIVTSANEVMQFSVMPYHQYIST